MIAIFNGSFFWVDFWQDKWKLQNLKLTIFDILGSIHKQLQNHRNLIYPDVQRSKCSNAPCLIILIHIRDHCILCQKKTVTTSAAEPFPPPSIICLWNIKSLSNLAWWMKPLPWEQKKKVSFTSGLRFHGLWRCAGPPRMVEKKIFHPGKCFGNRKCIALPRHLSRSFIYLFI